MSAKTVYEQMLFEEASMPSVWDLWIKYPNPLVVPKKTVEGCDHIIAHYEVCYEGGDVIRESDREDMSYVFDNNNYDLNMYKFCPDCGEELR